MAPAKPPITIFCGVARFKYIVYTTAYPNNPARVNTAVKRLTHNSRIIYPTIVNTAAKNRAFCGVTLPLATGRFAVRPILPSIFLSTT